jgi:hypothetical protein
MFSSGIMQSWSRDILELSINQGAQFAAGYLGIILTFLTAFDFLPDNWQVKPISRHVPADIVCSMISTRRKFITPIISCL